MNSNQKKKAVLVLGMHRSGTSAFTAGLREIFSIALGNVLRQATHANRKGYFENPRTWQINNALLAELGTAWDAYAGCRPRHEGVDNYPDFREAALAFLRDNFDDEQLFAIKDPRITVLLNFWEDALTAFGTNVQRIIVVRHPLEVARSQQTRYRRSFYKQVHASGSDLRYVLNLWFWYNLCLLRDLPDDQNLVVSFSDLMDDPIGQMQRVGRFLDLKPNTAALESYRKDFLDTNLKRQDVTPEAIQAFGKEYRYVFELYDRLTRQAGSERFSHSEAKAILQSLPDPNFLASWTAPVYAKMNCQMRYLEKYWILPKIMWKIKKLFYDINRVKQ